MRPLEDKEVRSVREDGHKATMKFTYAHGSISVSLVGLSGRCLFPNTGFAVTWLPQSVEGSNDADMFFKTGLQLSQFLLNQVKARVTRVA